MEIPAKYNVWVNKPGRMNHLLRWVGYRIRNGAMYVSFWGQDIVNMERIEKTKEIDLSKLYKDIKNEE
jgi:hypothetical protein